MTAAMSAHNSEARDQQSTKGPRAFECQIVRHDAAQLLGLNGGRVEGCHGVHARVLHAHTSACAIRMP